MSREVCGICWCPYDEDTGKCACAPVQPRGAMNKDEIIRMAREADDFADSYTPQYVTLPNEWSVIRDERFFLAAYAAGAAAEREAILQMSREQWFKTQADFEDAIRARGST